MTLLKTIQHIKQQGFTPQIQAQYSENELYVVRKILEEINENGQSDTLEALYRNDFERKPVSVDEFLTNDYYLGRVGRDIFDIWRKDLRQVLSPFNDVGEWIIKGSIGCVTGDTKISLLSGEEIPIKDLVGSEEIWVYSVDRDNEEIVPARATEVRRTGQGQPVWKVVLDSGEEIHATADHRFMLRSGAYKRLTELHPGDSLMPLYRRYHKGYELLKDLDGSWCPTHEIVAGSPDKGLSEPIVHHIDENKRNNLPSNLMFLEKGDHTSYHAYNYWNSEGAREERSKLTSERMKAGLASYLSILRWTPEAREEQALLAAEFNTARHPNLRKDITFDKVVAACIEEAGVDGTMTGVARRLRCSRMRVSTACREVGTSFRDTWYLCGGTLRTNSVGMNHKVVSVEFAGYKDVFDLEVEGVHNYAVSSGVFIHNSGKTFVAVVANLYKMYYLMCLRNPQKFHGLAEGSPIVFGLFNIYKYLAGATSYQYMITWLRDMSPFFADQRGDHLRGDKKLSNKQVLNLPKNISIALGAVAIHALGQNIFGGICDETEFGKSKSMTSQEKSQVADLYHNVRTRMDSRFMQRGGTNPGLLCLVSSTRDDEQFMAAHIRAKKDSDKTFISQYALYDVKEEYKDSPKFKVVVGDKLHRSYIVDEKNPEIRAGARVIEVPVEFKDAFEYDIDTAIRDIAGIETYGSTLFFPQRDRLLKALDKSTPREHPFSQDEVVLSLEDEIGLEDYFLQDELIELWDKTNLQYRPKFYPYADRYIHIDLAKNRDCAGMAMTCVSETVVIDRINRAGMRVKARDYMHFVDFMIRIRAAHGSEIDFAKIRQFVFFLIDTCHFRVRWVSYDSFQSTDSIQILKKEKIQAKELSLDKKPGPYRTFRSVLMEQRFDWYYYDPFFTEITKLEDHTLEGGKKIDHPIGGSKDVSDAACGSVIGSLLTKGVQITGTDAAQALDRANTYAKELKDPKKIKSVDWIKPETRNVNPLDKLFD